MAKNKETASTAAPYPGERLGLPREGRGSLASWWTRIVALIVDWAVSMAVAVGLFGTDVVNGSGWKAWMILVVFFVQSSVLSVLTGGSLGHSLARIGVYRMDGKPLGFLRGLVRAALICLAIPALVVDGDRRGLQDLVAGTVVINRR